MRRDEECVGKKMMLKDRCGGEEKERKTEEEVDGQCKCELEREGTVGGGDATLGCVDVTCQIHRPT